jgi:SAM-dependent methyltransferase
MPLASSKPEPKRSCTMRCPACGAETEHRYLYRKNAFDIARCEQCRLGRTLVSEFDAAAYYGKAYFSGGCPDGYADYLGAEAILRREFAHTVQFIRKFHATGKLIEIGCAYGFLLEAAQPWFDVSGIELAEDAARHCRRKGLNVLAGTVDATTLSVLGPADVIVMLDVIEHLPDPGETLAHCRRQLTPGGVIVLTTGDFDSILARLAGPHWRLMTPPQHLWFFNATSLAGLASRAGLRLQRLDHPWKRVPLSLARFQLERMLGRSPAGAGGMSRVGILVNLFDAMRVVLRGKET